VTRSPTLPALAAAAFLLATGGSASAQGAADPQLFAAGEAVYAVQCAVCHATDGSGRGSTFPALRGNANLADLSLVVANLREGQGFMPPFPALGAEDMAAVASYVRNAWGNGHGAAPVSEVATLLEGLDPPGEVVSIWDGVYTDAQADQGQSVFTAPCGLCHGSKLNGAPDDQDMQPAPPLARAKFLRVWDGRTLGTLYSYARHTMPLSNPGFLPEEDYAAIVAHMLRVTGAKAGDTPLSTDLRDLAHIVIGPKP
jgi:mono/diheme cytochrome c family protein